MSISGVGGGSFPFIPPPSSSGSTSNGGIPDNQLPDPTSDPIGWLMDYSKMSPAQQMQASALQSLGMTQAQFNALPADKKAKVEQEIEQMVKQKVEQQAEKKAGVLVDITA